MQIFLLMLLIIFLLTIISLGFGIACFIFWQEFQTMVRKQPPYVPIPKAVLPHIVQALALREGDVLFDLGCGDGRVLEAALKANQGIHAVGIDFAPLPIFFARYRLRNFLKQKKVRVIRDDMFAQDMHTATVVYTYLFPEFMDELLPKLQREFKPGTRLVSCDFEFANKKPIQIIDLHRPKGTLGRTLLVYEF